MSLSTLLKSNSRSKRTIFGYIRSMEDKLLKYKIPEMISYLILAYYQNLDYFGYFGKDITISNDKKTVTRIWDKRNVYTLQDNYLKSTVYGYHWIDCKKDQTVFWKFKYNDNARIRFGVRLKHGSIYGGHLSNYDGNSLWNSVNLQKNSQVLVELNTVDGSFKCTLTKPQTTNAILYQCNIYQLKFLSNGENLLIFRDHYQSFDDRRNLKCQIVLQIKTCYRNVSVTMIDSDV